VAAVFAHGETNRFFVFGKRRGVNHEIHLRHRFFAAPRADLVVDQINSCGAVGDLVGANHFLQMNADFRPGVRHGHANDGGILFEAAPVALVAEGLALEDANGREESPAANESSLAGREAAIFDGEELVVMKDVAMNHEKASVMQTRLYTGAAKWKKGVESSARRGTPPIVFARVRKRKKRKKLGRNSVRRFVQRVCKQLKRDKMRRVGEFRVRRETSGEVKNADLTHGQSRWLSKERSCG